MFGGGGGAGGGSETIVVPADKVSMIIGKGGAMIKNLQGAHKVKIDIPETRNMNPPPVNVNIVISGTDVLGARRAIEQLIGVSVAAGMAMDNGMAGGAAGGAAKTGLVYVFRSDPVRLELQLLLQHKNRVLNVPNGKVDNADAVNSYQNEVLRLLQEGCSLPAWASSQLRHVRSIDVTHKSIHHLACAPDLQWQPQPRADQQHMYSDELLSINGTPVQTSFGHCWVDVGLLKAESDVAATILPKDLLIWFRKNAEEVIPEVLKLYPGCKITPVPVVAGAAAAARDVVQPGWTLTPAGHKVMENLKHIAMELGTMTPDVFVNVSERCFNPHHLMAVFQKWKAAGGNLPNSPETIQ
eukprot:m.90029 g.90029  ORF g.90029 m.90029 type:complete len:354 (+) comp15245_c0_seq2:289-1350(+)